MTGCRFALAVTIVTLLAWAPLTHADCAPPQAPPPVPDGNSASAADMNAAKAALDKYEEAVKDHLACLDKDTQSQIAALGSNVDGIRQVKLMSAKRTSIVQDELQKHADEYDEQLRAFKLLNRQ